MFTEPVKVLVPCNDSLFVTSKTIPRSAGLNSSINSPSMPVVFCTRKDNESGNCRCCFELCLSLSMAVSFTINTSLQTLALNLPAVGKTWFKRFLRSNVCSVQSFSLFWPTLQGSPWTELCLFAHKTTALRSPRTRKEKSDTAAITVT